MDFQQNISLKTYNTFNVDSIAKHFVALSVESEVIDIVGSDIFKQNRFLVLGHGSNILFIDDFNGLVIRNEIKGNKIVSEDDNHILIEVGAGENWHNFVSDNLASGFYGLENLALIPGTVGSAAIQNIGAYGIEQKDFLDSVYGFNIETKKYQRLTNTECEYGYRSSIFKSELKDKFIITSIRYKLNKIAVLNYNYKDITEHLNQYSITYPTPKDIFDAVVYIRTHKLPDWHLIGNAGSFFKNPVVPKSKSVVLKEEYPEMPVYHFSDESDKISAAWIIQKAGWKGHIEGSCGVYEHHSLILVNLGNATGKEIYDLSQKIQANILAKFDIQLEPEVLIIGN